MASTVAHSGARQVVDPWLGVKLVVLSRALASTSSIWYSQIPFLRMCGISQSAAGSKMTTWKFDRFFGLILRTFRMVLLCFLYPSTDRPDFRFLLMGAMLKNSGSCLETTILLMVTETQRLSFPLGAHFTSSSHF